MSNPYRAAPANPISSATEPDPIRRWYMNNANWAYHAMDWDEKAQAPSKVSWVNGSTALTLQVSAGQMQLMAEDPRIQPFLASRLSPVRVTLPLGTVFQLTAPDFCQCLLYGPGPTPQQINHGVAITSEGLIESLITEHLQP